MFDTTSSSFKFNYTPGIADIAIGLGTNMTLFSDMLESAKAYSEETENPYEWVADGSILLTIADQSGVTLPPEPEIGAMNAVSAFRFLKPWFQKFLKFLWERDGGMGRGFPWGRWVGDSPDVVVIGWHKEWPKLRGADMSPDLLFEVFNKRHCLNGAIPIDDLQDYVEQPHWSIQQDQDEDDGEGENIEEEGGEGDEEGVEDMECAGADGFFFSYKSGPQGLFGSELQ